MPPMWTPPDADPLLAAVILREPAEPLTKGRYLGLLAGRIATMIEKAGGEASAALELAGQEDLDLAGLAPPSAAMMLVRDSEALAMALGDLDALTWPIPLAQMDSDPEAQEEIRATDLWTFLHRLY